jgi:two-component system phosphate regulon sensor histidine kinase PhoR
MKEDIRRFAAVIIFSLLIGLVTQQVAICLFSGVFLYLIWQYRILKQLHLWLQRRSGSNPPELPGIINEISREIDFLRERHRQRKDKLAGYLRRFQDGTYALPDAMLILGQYGVIEWANEKAREYLGIRWPQDNGQRIANLIRHPELSAFLGNTGNKATDKGLQISSPINPDQIIEFRIASYGEGQKLLMARDVTSIQRIHQMRKDFIANASHELRTPLTVISGYLEGMDDDMEQTHDVLQSQIKQMRRQCERMQRLIDDLLMLSMLETNAPDTEGEIVMVPDLLATIYQEAEGLSGIMKHIFYLETDPNLWLHGNQKEIYSAFSNLVFNAVQHTQEHGIIRLRWYADSEGAHFVVSDNGEGIAPEHIPRITERFYRVDKGRSRDKGGTGLGLAIVKHVLARHGGQLHIDSTLGKGSTFRCDFPARNIVYKSGSAVTGMSA